MQITCWNDKNTWKVGTMEIAAAKLRFSLGFPHETFVCPKCHKANRLTKAEFQAAMAAPEAAPKPVGPAAPRPTAAVPPGAPIQGQQAPPIGVGAGPAMAKRTGKVVVRSLRVRSGHGKEHPVVAGLVKDQKVEVTGTWTDGKDTWAQLGPDQWAAVIYDGKPMIDLD